MAGAAPVASWGASACWEAEPWEAERFLRGRVGASGVPGTSGVPAPVGVAPAAGVSGPACAAGPCDAEPSVAVRVRRGGLVPSAEAVRRAGRAGAALRRLGASGPPECAVDAPAGLDAAGARR